MADQQGWRKVVGGSRFFPEAVLSLLVMGCGAGEDSGLVEEVGTTKQGVTKAADPSANGDTDFCNAASAPCAGGEGDCDADAQCEAGLICGVNNGPKFGMAAGWDVCVAETCTNGLLDAGETAVDCGGDCGTEGACAGTCPDNGGTSTCTADCRCASGWGDCDSNAQCQSDLVCGTNNGAKFGMAADWDVCVAETCTNGVLDAGETSVDCGGDCGTEGACSACPENGGTSTCTADCRCAPGWGDCDSSAQCQDGLICGTNNGAKFGMAADWDVCVAETCTNGVLDASETSVDCGGDCGTEGACSACPENGSTSTCTADCRCASGWGDCDSNAQCQAGIICGTNNGAKFGMAADWDVCVAETCTNGILDAGETVVDCGGDCGTTCTCGGATEPAPGSDCTTSQPGVCAVGTIQCLADTPVCVARTSATDEICDGLDNDCDGEADEENPGGGDVCETGLAGACAVGTLVCAEGALVCTATVDPSDELCDGADNDCDGDTDESFPEEGTACDTGLLGVCAIGAATCTNAELDCEATAIPEAEICDGLDNDCNGSADADPAGETDGDADGVRTCEADCNDADPNNWIACTSCVDTDGDGYFVGCDAFVTHPGPDCDDGDPETTECVLRNVILMVGDGFGFEHIKATRMYANGDTEPLFLETLPAAGEVITVNAGGTATDSAASASAMATGRKYSNGAISFAGGREITSVLEQHQAAGKSTGLITIDTPVVDATPAAFGAHEASRTNMAAIATDLQTGSRPNILFGEADTAVSTTAFASAGYTVVTSAAELAAVPADTPQLLGVFANDSPTLAERAAFALSHLSQDPDGFFLLVEHEGTDESSHARNATDLVAAGLEFNAAVEIVANWANSRSDTLLVVLADHETGGLTVTETTPQAGEVPSCTWSSNNHTTANTPVFVLGGTLPASVIDNTEVFALLGGYFPPAPNSMSFQNGVGGYEGTVDTWLQEATPDTGHAADVTLEMDADDPRGSGQENQTLIRFEGIFGEAAGQIPPTASIEYAGIALQVSNSGAAVTVHEMLVPWTEEDAWSTFGGDGIQAGAEASASLGTSSSIATGEFFVDVTASVMAWLSNPEQNLGWALLSTGSDGAVCSSSEGTAPPRLVVEYR